MFPKDIRSWSLELVDVTLFGKRVFAGVIRLRVWDKEIILHNTGGSYCNHRHPERSKAAEKKNLMWPWVGDWADVTTNRGMLLPPEAGRSKKQILLKQRGPATPWFVPVTLMVDLFFSFFLDYIYLFLERGKGKEKEGEKHHCVVASHAPPTRDLSHNPGMCSDWESNQWPFGSQASAQSTEPHQQGLMVDFWSPFPLEHKATQFVVFVTATIEH